MEKLTTLEKQVLLMIPQGNERPIKSRELASALSLDERNVMGIVARLISHYRVPIIGDRGMNGGYYIPETEEERTHGLQALQSQTLEQTKRLNIVTYCSLSEWKKLIS